MMYQKQAGVNKIITATKQYQSTAPSGAYSTTYRPKNKFQVGSPFGREKGIHCVGLFITVSI